MLPAVAELSTVLAYDRGGLGWSDPPPQPHDLTSMSQELGELLQRSEFARPYLLVAI